MFRPQSLTIRQAGSAAASNEINIRGVVRQKEFLGSLVRYEIGVGDTAILVDDSHRRGEPPFSIGAEVALGLASEQVVMLAD